MVVSEEIYGWCDESRYNQGKYRAISIFSHQKEDTDYLISGIGEIVEKSGITEMKWKHVKNDKKSKVVKDSLDFLIRTIKQRKKIRVDVLIWDVEDSRHKVMGRDDIMNLQVMYYHLFENVIEKRWRGTKKWRIYPDRNSSIKWTDVRKILSRRYNIEELTEKDSVENVLIQISDIFSGMGAYTWNSIEKYPMWIEKHFGQSKLFEEEPPATSLTNKDRYRWEVINTFYSKIKKLDLEGIKGNKAIEINTSRKMGFKTRNPEFPINFWFYIPQTDLDKAPIKNDPIGPRRKNPKGIWWYS